MTAPNAIFISYRRSDSQDITGRIYEYLQRHFGAAAVFRDVYSIPYGDDYRLHLQENAQSAQVTVVVIGPDWLTAADASHNRRLDNPNDWVRIEVATALSRNIPVVPLLVDGARMPEEASLPDDLKPLAHRNAALARPDPDFVADMERLITQLEKIVAPSAAEKPLTRAQQRRREYLKTKLNDLENQLLAVQKELGVIADVTIAAKLEKRQQLLWDEMDQVEQDIQRLEAGDD